ncbi:MAG: hypothetical protein K0S23_946 [Fluviicola sp.]|uniref:DUF1801 domain-containing protein n=1 Tax=Fluviicola sp. TaxID=1917219 RepID=UPI00261933B2|nr:DUF1801 domain-containing protein [Fluviicola sp.]MDF3026639.1 hypothetical protein [Fluviicola sp.]
MKDDVLTALDSYYDKQESTIKECLLALKSIILSVDKNVVHTRKYQIPFFCYKEFNLGFLWVNKKRILVGFVEDKKILSLPLKGRGKHNVTTFEVNPLEDIPVDKIKQTFKQLIEKYEH